MMVFVPVIFVSNFFDNLTTIMNFNSSVLLTFQITLPNYMLINLAQEREEIHKARQTQGGKVPKYLTIPKSQVFELVPAWKVRFAWFALLIGMQNMMIGFFQVMHE